jgi:hypothetical protein
MRFMAVFAVNQRQTSDFLDAMPLQIGQYGRVRQRQLA